jgi:integral membrane protein
MIKFFNTNIGRLRLLGILEGLSLLVLIFIAMPMKYLLGNPALVKSIGPVHGVLFIFFVINAITVGVEYKWKFTEVTWKVVLASFIPFGTFYIDRTILSKVSVKGE